MSLAGKIQVYGFLVNVVGFLAISVSPVVGLFIFAFGSGLAFGGLLVEVHTPDAT